MSIIRGITEFIAFTLVVALVGGVLIVLGQTVFTSATWDAFDVSFITFSGGLIVGLSPIVAGLRFVIRRNKTRKCGAEKERVVQAVETHRVALKKNLDMAVTVNDYGAVTSDKRSEVMGEFFVSIGLDEKALPFSQAAELVVKRLEEHSEDSTHEKFDPSIIPSNGLAFEQWVASSLEKFGWETKMTPGSGDQGIDVIAECDGHRVGVQCKLSSTSIGNKAVQEAFAGRAYYSLDAVAVVSNAPYTIGAQRLSSSTGVRLLKPHDFPLLRDIVGVNSPKN